MQQINPELYDDIRAAFQALGYDALTHQKRMQRNSLAIFYRSPLKKAWEKHVTKKGLEKTLAVGLKCGDRILAVVTCQLESEGTKPEEPSMAKERIERLAKTFDEMRDVPHDALVVAGDFNAP